MPKTRLTMAEIARHPPAAKAFTLWDTEITGLGVRVQPGGSRSFIIEYRPAGAQRTAPRKRMRLGDVKSMGLDAARKAARDVLAEVRVKGADPMRERREARDGVTLGEAAEAYFADRSTGTDPLKESTLREYKRLYEVNLGPALGSRGLATISAADAYHLHRSIGRTFLANRVLALLGSIWGWASLSPRTWVDGDKSPVRAVKRNAENQRKRYLSREEVARLADALDRALDPGLPWAPLDQKADPKRAKHRVKERNRVTRYSFESVAAVRLLMLTGARRGEILGLRWEHVKGNKLDLPDSKTGAKTIRLSAAAVEVLGDLRERAEKGAEYVFVGAGETGRIADVKRLWTAATRTAGLDKLRLHDLRHSFASHGLAAGLTLEVVGGLLGHRSTQTTRRYAHLIDETAEAATDTLGAHFDAMLSRRGGQG